MSQDRDQEALEALAAFAPLFADPAETFGSWAKLERVEGEPARLPYVELTELAERFLRTCAEHGWVRPDIDWPRWSATPEAQRLRDDPSALAAATSDDLAHLLTTLVRGDRFDDGRLLWAFESGLLRRIAERAAQLARAHDTPA
jgi:hypothetical protein